MTNKTDTTLDSALEQSLNDIGSPPRPLIIDRISDEIKKAEPDFKRLTSLITADVSLAASLIKTANSPFYGFANKVRSAGDALTILGLNATSRAIAGISLRKAFPRTVQMERFWDASASISTLSGWLAHSMDKVRLQPNDAHTYGLFRDCGIAVLLVRFPAYAQVLTRANNDAEHSFTGIELETMPTDHAMVGCLLAQNWWLPHEICLAIRHHHDVNAIDLMDSNLPMASRQLVAIGQLAEYLLQLTTQQSYTSEWAKLGPSCRRVLDITEDELPALQSAAAEALRAD